MAKGRDAKAEWQVDFDLLRREIDSQYMVRRKLVFVPAWLAHLYGGVFMWLGWVFVGADMIDVPFFARRFMLSQILSRSRQGGHFAGIGIFMCIATMMFIINAQGSAVLGLIIGCGALMLLIWANRPVRQFAADDDSAADIGKKGVQAGIVWIVSRRLGTMSEETLDRLRRQGWDVEPSEVARRRRAPGSIRSGVQAAARVEPPADARESM